MKISRKKPIKHNFKINVSRLDTDIRTDQNQNLQVLQVSYYVHIYGRSTGVLEMDSVCLLWSKETVWVSYVFQQTSVMKYIFQSLWRRQNPGNTYFLWFFFDILSDLSVPKANTHMSFSCTAETISLSIPRSQKHVQLSNSHILWYFCTMENGALTWQEHSKHKCVIFLLTKDSFSVQSYSADEFLHVEMTSHQQGEDVPLFKRHGAEGLQDSLICVFQAPRCCGVAVTQVDQPG